MPNPVVHFEIIGNDGAKTQKFYADLFGWKVDANNPMSYGSVESQDGHGIGGGLSKDEGGSGPRVTVYAEVDDIDAYLKKAESLGGKTIMEKTSVPGGPTIGMFTDPDGNIFGLVTGM